MDEIEISPNGRLRSSKHRTPSNYEGSEGEVSERVVQDLQSTLGALPMNSE